MRRNSNGRSGNRETDSGAEMDTQARTADGLEDLIRNLSVEVAMGTDGCYREVGLYFPLESRILE
jgi:hypothetical protein